MVGRCAALGMGLDGVFRTSRAGKIAGHAQLLGHKCISRSRWLLMRQMWRCRYAALGMEPGGGFRTAESLAAALGAPSHLPSRGKLALLHTLGLAAAKSGHSYLPWGTLAAQTERLLASTGARPRASRLGARTSPYPPWAPAFESGKPFGVK